MMERFLAKLSGENLDCGVAITVVAIRVDIKQMKNIKAYKKIYYILLILMILRTA